MKLEKNKLIQQKVIQQNDGSATTSSVEKQWSEETLLLLPVFVQKFALSQISDNLSKKFHEVLSDYYKNEFAKIFVLNNNEVEKSNPNAQLAIKKISQLADNFRAFIQRMNDLYSEDNFDLNSPINESPEENVNQSPGVASIDSNAPDYNISCVDSPEVRRDKFAN